MLNPNLILILKKLAELELSRACSFCSSYGVDSSLI